MRSTPRGHRVPTTLLVTPPLPENATARVRATGLRRPPRAALRPARGAASCPSARARCRSGAAQRLLRTGSNRSRKRHRHGSGAAAATDAAAARNAPADGPTAAPPERPTPGSRTRPPGGERRQQGRQAPATQADRPTAGPPGGLAVGRSGRSSSGGPAVEPSCCSVSRAAPPGAGRHRQDRQAPAPRAGRPAARGAEPSVAEQGRGDRAGEGPVALRVEVQPVTGVEVGPQPARPRGVADHAVEVDQRVEVPARPDPGVDRLA